MSKTKGFLLVTAVAAMTALTISCSVDGCTGDEDGSSSSVGGGGSSSSSEGRKFKLTVSNMAAFTIGKQL